MATTYHYRLFETELGPVGFRELVHMVRDGTLGADDLVKADWEADWHPAADVVGLFHMAGRADVLAKWEAETRLQVNAADGVGLDEMPERTESVEAEIETPWERDLRDIQSRRELADAEKSEAEMGDVDAAHTQQEIRDTISEAVVEFERREAAGRPGRIRRWKEAAFSSSMMHSIFRWGMAFAAANLIAVGIFSWSEKEALRYPERQQAAVQQQVFPVWGKCSSGEYLLMVAHAMILAGAIGYGTARGLESFCDD
jgi:hypothetical protein